MIDARVRIGHVHLKVADLDRAHLAILYPTRADLESEWPRTAAGTLAMFTRRGRA